MNKTYKTNFLVLGVPKAGTTSLYEYLKEHPQIYLPSKKELHHFSYSLISQRTQGPGDKDVLRELTKEPDQYQKLYTGVTSKHKVIGEISPSYYYFINKIGTDLKNKMSENPKVCIILRNPIYRTYSNYKHQVRMGYEKESFDVALKNEEKRTEYGYGDFWMYKKHSFYAENLRQTIKIFGKENTKVLIFEEFIQEPHKSLIELFDFLEVDSEFKPDSLRKVFNEGGGYNNNMLSRFLLQPNKFKNWFKKIVPKNLLNKLTGFKSSYLSKNSKKFQSMDETMINELVQFFKEDVNQVKSILNNRIDVWDEFK
ncbi:sulfotransferase [Muricauda sp. CAU 1633]|uniref:sulfotransferase family protein n=1 Tax=Allomuricauda sp. CAU 1633 TaxID=2816036 RepID=UPI001A8C191E|nr:sulfotransferase [Muricauda sp. CAU 1633]MBO0320979.1 sulfotransferase [Muricauda sp. CAU 1633]